MVKIHRQACNNIVHRKRCRRKASIMNIESSDICSCWCSVKIRLISPEKPQELDSSVLNRWKISSLHSLGRNNNIADGLWSTWAPLFLLKAVHLCSGAVSRHEKHSEGNLRLQSEGEKLWPDGLYCDFEKLLPHFSRAWGPAKILCCKQDK